MTQRQFDANIRRLLLSLQKKIRDNPELEKMLRAELREERGLVYVREYVVAARFRQYRSRKKISKNMEHIYKGFNNAAQ